jgi:hypothetical protein
MNMKASIRDKFWLGVLALAANLPTVPATERLFTYSYEPETMPQRALEFEQWVTLRTQRTRGGQVKQQNFNRWEIREELEYGVTDDYTVGLYLNSSAQSFRDPRASTEADNSHFRFDGISLENRYQVLNPAEHRVGLSLYLEPRFAGDEAELEEKIILGQRHGDWKWAFNLTHATEWEENFRATEGEVEATFGLTRMLGKHWALGLELRDHNEIPDYGKWENTALFAGPVTTYRQENWWVTLTVLPQIWGENFGENPDGNRWLELEGHERVNIRLIFGIGF